MATSNNQFRLRLYPSTSYNFIVDWGDGTSDVFNGTTPTYQGATGSSTTWSTQISAISASWPGITHTYSAPAKYTVKISEIIPGGFSGLQYRGVDDEGSNTWNPADEFNNDAKKVTAVSQWGSINWSSSKAMANSFEGCINLKDVVTDGGTSTLSALSSFNQAWYGCTNLSSFDVIDTSNITNFSYTWYNCASLTAFPLIDTSKGTNFNQTWLGCSNLRTFPLINTLSGNDFAGAWNGCTSLTAFPLLDTSKGTTFSNTWNQCRALSSFPLINTSNVTNFYSTWNSCSNLKDFPLINFSKAVAPYFTWASCTSLTSFPLIDTSNCTSLGLTWNNCSSLSSFPTIDTSKVRDFDRTWGGCTSMIEFPLIDTLSATTRLYHTWEYNYKLKTFPQINTKNTPNFDSAWLDCVSLTGFPLIDTSNGTNFAGTWYNCISLSDSEFPTLNMSKMTNGTNCFAGVKLTTTSYSSLLTSLCATNFNNTVAFHGGNSTFNTPGSAAKVFLTTSIANGGRGWTINDGGYEPGT